MHISSSEEVNELFVNGIRFIPEQKSKQVESNKDWEIISYSMDGIWEKRKDDVTKCMSDESMWSRKYGAGYLSDENMQKKNPTIRSVKILSTNETFSIDDITDNGRITGFEIDQHLFADIFAEFENNRYKNILFIKKVKQPLFTTDQKQNTMPEQSISENILRERIKDMRENIPVFSYNKIKELSYHESIETGTLHISIDALQKYIDEKIK